MHGRTGTTVDMDTTLSDDITVSVTAYDGAMDINIPLLREGGAIYIGNVAFAARAELEACRAQSGTCWDKDEIYFVYDELKKAFPAMTFDRLSPCSGILSLRK